MPIPIEDVKKYKGYTDDEVKIVNFLNKNKGQAFTEDELWRAIIKPRRSEYVKDEKGSIWTLQNIAIFALDVVNETFFGYTLREMVKKGKICVSEYSGEKYYFIE